ncbi:MAG: YigZ family protein [Lachnospiraceae bacterium]|nr:YigZ family protein [Lachnospiraceae bacterium]MDE7331288.1 YigZ family protein [Lachnospiraceae bacterium]
MGKEMEFLPYQVIYQPGYGEYEEKKSRFIAHISPAGTEEEAVAFIDSIKKKHYDARHNCSAFVIGRNRELTRCNDDGEPGGTAGKPMLEVLLSAGVTNGAAVVTRYFGGTLLGTGGLVRAYTQAVQAALDNAEIALMRYGTEMTVHMDYTDVGKVQYLIAGLPVQTLDSRYTEKVEFDIRVPKEQEESIKKKIIEATCARAGITIKNSGYYMDRQT